MLAKAFFSQMETEFEMAERYDCDWPVCLFCDHEGLCIDETM